MGILTPEMLTNVYEAIIIKVIDGDTIDLKVNLGFNMQMNIRVRLKDIDAPEMYAVKKTSKEYIEGLKARLTVISFIGDSGSKVYVNATKKGIYGRWLGEIWRSPNENSLNDYLIKKFYKSEYWEISAQNTLIEKWITEKDWNRYAEYDFAKYGLHKYNYKKIGSYGESAYGNGIYKNIYTLEKIGYYDKSLYENSRYDKV